MSNVAGSVVSGSMVQVDEAEVRSHVEEVVRRSVEETLNGLLEAEADQLCGAQRYERTPDRVDTRAGSYERKLETKAGRVTLKVPRLRSLPFETQIIERYRRRESSVEEALMEMYLAGVSVRRVEDITEALWGTRVSPSAVSELNQKLYERIEAWRNEPIVGRFAYVSLDGIWLKRSWGGEVKNVAVLVAVGVDAEGYRHVLGVCEGAKEDAASWRGFLRHLKERGLTGVRLITSDKCLGLVEALGEFYPEADWQRCMVHWYRNVSSVVPQSKTKEVMAMLKAIHAQEDRQAAQAKAVDVVAKLRAMKLAQAAAIVEEGVGETLSYMAYPREHWTRIRTNNPLERIMREIRRRTRVVGAFPDGHSALMLVAAPIDVVVDSTGLKVYGEGEWKVRKHGVGKRRTWRKLHLAVDPATHQIVAETLTENSEHDADQAEPLLAQVETEVQTFYGDGAYDQWKVYDALDARGVDAIIPPRRNAKIKRHGNSAEDPLPRDECIRQIRRDGRKAWKESIGYHRRSLAETAMSRLKASFGDRLKNRKTPNQTIEAALRCKLLNAFVAFGMPLFAWG